MSKEPTVIAKSLEKFTSMQIVRNVFKDSLLFMDSRLKREASERKFEYLLET